MGCEMGYLSDSYLGLPLCLDPPDSFWSSMIDKFHKNLASWKGTLLSQAGKIIVLKASLQSIPLYVLSIFKIPRKFVDEIEKI